jgi:hypothetical protein
MGCKRLDTGLDFEEASWCKWLLLSAAEAPVGERHAVPEYLWKPKVELYSVGTLVTDRAFAYRLPDSVRLYLRHLNFQGHIATA